MNFDLTDDAEELHDRIIQVHKAFIGHLKKSKANSSPSSSLSIEEGLIEATAFGVTVSAKPRPVADENGKFHAMEYPFLALEDEKMTLAAIFYLGQDENVYTDATCINKVSTFNNLHVAERVNKHIVSSLARSAVFKPHGAR